MMKPRKRVEGSPPGSIRSSDHASALYDLSGPDATQVLLELGAAIVLGKEIFVLHKKGTSLPEVLKPFERVEYENLSDLTEKLKKRIRIS